MNRARGERIIHAVRKSSARCENRPSPKRLAQAVKKRPAARRHVPASKTPELLSTPYPRLSTPRLFSSQFAEPHTGSGSDGKLSRPEWPTASQRQDSHVLASSLCP